MHYWVRNGGGGHLGVTGFATGGGHEHYFQLLYFLAFGSSPFTQQRWKLTVGEANFLNVRAQRIELLGGNYGECSNSWDESLNLNKKALKLNYSEEMCHKFCIMNELAKNFNCVDTLPKDTGIDAKEFFNTKYCESADINDKMCRSDVYQRFIAKTLNCPCKSPCNRTEFQYITSRSPWPSVSYSSYLAARIVQTSAPWVRWRIAEQIPNSSKSQVDHIIRDNFARVEISFMMTPFQKITEKPIYTVTDLISDFGGNISLWQYLKYWSCLCAVWKPYIIGLKLLKTFCLCPT